MRVDVTFLPAPHVDDRTCLVVDVLRATSTVAVLLARGIEAIYVAPTVEVALSRRAQLQRRLGRDVGLLGERGGLRPDGFDLGNSPRELTTASLPWREVVLATSNGTPALLACARAPLTLAAAPLNANAVTAAAVAPGRDVLIVCAGTAGRYAEDDALAAGLLVQRLAAAGAEPEPGARIPLADYERASADLAGALRATRHGDRLVRMGFDRDVELCAEADRFDVAGRLHAEPEGDGGEFVLRPLAAKTETAER